MDNSDGSSRKDQPIKKKVFRGLMSVDRNQAIKKNWDKIQSIVKPVIAGLNKKKLG